jgi:type IV secretory pathway VirB10-like protein
MNDKADIPRTIHLYSQECVKLLRTALGTAETDLEPTLTYYDTRTKDADSSSDEEENNEDSNDESSSSSSSQGESDTKETLTAAQSGTNEAGTQDQSALQPQKTKKRPPKKNQKERQQEALLQQLGTPPMLSLPLDGDTCVNVPSALLVKHERHYGIDSCAKLVKLSESVATQPVIVLLLRSGRFAGGVFCQNKCLVHRTCQRYTVRKGQGKAQSTQDGSRRPKSMGAQLRRQGELKLWQDIKETMQQWKQFLHETPLILMSCPKTLQKGLLEAADTLLDRDLIRKIPFDAGPTFESVVAVHEKMMQVVVDVKLVAVEPAVENVDTCAERGGAIETLTIKDDGDQKEVKEIVKEFPPLTPLHTFAAEGNVDACAELFESDSDACAELINHGAGQDYMTPLHYAAESTSNDGVDPTIAASVVLLLLVRGGANPCSVDARNRVPYFLASHDKVREAFRRARAELGEDCWPWDTAKVGPALTEDDVVAKKEKAAEKKRRQRVRQKEKKAREKAEAEAMEQRKRQEEEKRKQEEDAKRIRDGLAPKKSTATNVCDFCQTVCKGKRRNQMFQRLGYVYCSSECVQKHKRELMAQAALSRFG